MILQTKQPRIRFLNAACISLAVFILAGIVVLPLAKTTNCGRNSAALAACRMIYLQMHYGPEERDHRFNPLGATTDAWAQSLKYADSSWTQDAGYWLRTNHIDLAQTNQILIFCDQLYDNVPQPTIWNLYRRNPAHAVIRVSGETDLITSRKLAQLDRKDFVLLKPENVKPFIHTP